MIIERRIVKKSIEFEDIERAKNILSIEDFASIKVIRSHYIELVKSNHPDKFPNSDKEKYGDKIKEINNAYKLLMDYCENYDISFKIEDFLRTKRDTKFDEFMKEWF